MAVSNLCVVGGGIVGLAVGWEVARRRPDVKVTVFEKESSIASHQTGHNSGVIHAGVYYRPGSLKARLCRRGNDLLRAFCVDHGVRIDEVGKLIIAKNAKEIPLLGRIRDRAEANQVPDIAWINRAQLTDIEPHVIGVAGLHSPHTAIVSFKAVAEALASDLRRMGGTVLLGQMVEMLTATPNGVHVRVNSETTIFDRVVVCAGLGGDALTRSLGLTNDLQIIPFRGEYYRLGNGMDQLVRGLIYPVPDPRYPFLGVHLTRHIDGDVLVGPNAVLALGNESYSWGKINLHDVRNIAAWSGMRRLALRHWRTGLYEVAGSISKTLFTQRASQYIPEIKARDLERFGTGIRAQAVSRKGELVDDFVIEQIDGLTLVRNAPSPAATSSFAIAEHICNLSLAS